LQRELEQREADYYNLLGLLPDAVAVLDGRGKVLDINRAFELETGFDRKDIVDRHFSRLPTLVAFDLPNFMRMFFGILSNREIKDYVFRYRRKDRSTGWGKASARAIRNTEGKLRIMVVLQDVTERKRIEEFLHEEQQRFKQYLEIVGVIIVALEPDETVSLISRKGCELLGYPQEEIVGRNWFDDFVPETERERTRAGFHRIMAGDLAPVEYFENYVLTRRGEERMISWHNTVLRDEGGRILCSLSSGQDVTETRRIFETLERSEERFRRLGEILPQVLWIRNRDTAELVYINSAFESLFGLTVEEMKQNPDSFIELIVEMDRKAVEEAVADQFENGRNSDLIYRINAPDGSKRWIRDRAFVSGNWIYGIAEDVTEVKRSELVQRETSDGLRKLADRLEQNRENERADTSLAIHDDLVQSLIAIKLFLHSISQQQEKVSPDSQLRYEEVLKELDRVIKAANFLHMKLRPPMLDELGLGVTLAWELEEFGKQYGYKISDHLEAPDLDMPVRLKTTVYRVFQELLDNIRSHAQATRIEVSLRLVEGALVLVVRDNGIGLTRDLLSDPQATGILGIKERAKSLGGSFAIKGIPKAGTTATLRVPVNSHRQRNLVGYREKMVCKGSRQ
jgi:PAS domain S-box-containing protein